MLADVEDRFLSLRPVGARGTAGEGRWGGKCKGEERDLPLTLRVRY